MAILISAALSGIYSVLLSAITGYDLFHWEWWAMAMPFFLANGVAAGLISARRT